jgi:hypothetical protein
MPLKSQCDKRDRRDLLIERENILPAFTPTPPRHLLGTSEAACCRSSAIPSPRRPSRARPYRSVSQRQRSASLRRQGRGKQPHCAPRQPQSRLQPARPPRHRSALPRQRYGSLSRQGRGQQPHRPLPRESGNATPTSRPQPATAPFVRCQQQAGPKIGREAYNGNTQTYWYIGTSLPRTMDESSASRPRISCSTTEKLSSRVSRPVYETCIGQPLNTATVFKTKSAAGESLPAPWDGSQMPVVALEYPGQGACER